MLLGLSKELPKIGVCPQKNDEEKIALLGTKWSFWAIRAIKRSAERPNRHIPENRRYPELPQDMRDL